MKKPRLSENTIEKLYNGQRVYSKNYMYEVTRDWSDEYNTYVDKLTRWEEDGDYNDWLIPAEGIWAFEKKD